MQAAFPTTDRRRAALFASLPGAQGMASAALEGLGRAWTDSPAEPGCAVAAAGDFLLCGGRPGLSAAHLLRHAVRQEKREWIISGSDAWLALAERMLPVERITRWAFDHHVQPEDRRLRELLTNMPEGAEFRPIEGEWIGWCRRQAWSEDFVSLYSDESYARRGLGFLLTVDGEAVAGAGSYVSYPGGIEVQLQTREDQQGRGYAVLAAARLILAAHERGLVASWDAASPASAHIACKLGYRPAGAYQALLVRKT